MTRFRCVILNLVLSVACLCGVTDARAVSAASQPIEPQPLTSALKVFAQSTGLQLVYVSNIAAGLETKGSQGGLSPAETLKALLIGTGLTFEFVNERTVSIRPVVNTAQRVSSLSAMEERPAAEHAAEDGVAAESGRAQPEQQEGASPDGKADSSAGEVVVTGTHIRGVTSVTSSVMSFDRQYIERSGFSNTQQLIETLPQNSQGGASGSTETGMFGEGSFRFLNDTQATGVNLRGFGATATLTLINGRRVAPSADGQFVDIGAIPISAIERVEVLTDGASAVYGADAVAGVINIILRDDFEGAETSVRYGSVTSGSLDETRLSHAFGKHWTGGGGMVSAEYYKRARLGAEQRSYTSGLALPNDLLPDRSRAGLMLNLHHRLSTSLDALANAMYSYEEVESTMNFFNTLQLRSSHTNQWNAFIGIGYEPFGDWRFELGTALSRVNPRLTSTQLDAGTNQMIAGIKDFDQQFDQKSVDLKADGALFRLPAGSVRLAVGASYRDDESTTSLVRVMPPSGFERQQLGRDVTSLYAELYIPVLRRLALSVAGRYDDYSDFGTTTNPKVGILLTPVDGLDLRASYSTSFRAPTITELKGEAQGSASVFVSNPAIFAAPDGSSGTIPVFLMCCSGHIGPEESRNMTFGFSYTMAQLPRLQLTFNYFDIDYKDRISQPPLDLGILLRRNEVGPLITELADDTAAEAFLNTLLAQGFNFFDVSGVGFAGVRYAYDFRLRNAARSKVSGFDVTAAYALERGENTVDLSVNVSHLQHFLNAFAATSDPFDTVDTFGNPLDWRMRGMGTWSRGGLAATVAVNYADNYIDDEGIIDAPVAAWTTFDVNLSYAFSADSPYALLRGSRLSVSVQNLFDKEPPRAVRGFAFSGYDPGNANPLGRFVALQVGKQW